MRECSVTGSNPRRVITMVSSDVYGGSHDEIIRMSSPRPRMACSSRCVSAIFFSAVSPLPRFTYTTRWTAVSVSGGGVRSGLPGTSNPPSRASPPRSGACPEWHPAAASTSVPPATPAINPLKPGTCDPRGDGRRTRSGILESRILGPSARFRGCRRDGQGDNVGDEISGRMSISVISDARCTGRRRRRSPLYFRPNCAAARHFHTSERQ